MSKLELVEDIFIVLDLVVSSIAAFLKGGEYDSVSETLFMVSAVLLIIAVSAMVLKRIFEK